MAGPPHIPNAYLEGGSFQIGPSDTLTQMWTRIYVLSQILAEFDAFRRLITGGVLIPCRGADCMMTGCFGIMQGCVTRRGFLLLFYFYFYFYFYSSALLSDTIAFASFRRIHYSCLFWSFPILAHYIEAIPRLNPNCKP